MRTEVIRKKRIAKTEGKIFVPSESKIFVVTRTKGLNRVPPKEKKILQLLRLRQLHNCVFLKNNKATQRLLQRVNPYVAYGYPSLSTVK